VKQISLIKEYENVKDFYYVDKEGNIFSKGNNGGKLLDKPIKKKLQIKTNGYLNVGLAMKNNTQKWFRVNRIVAAAFIENPFKKAFVNHINEVRTDNRVENLEWVTPKENNLHSLSKKMYVYTMQGKLIKTYNYTYECIKDGFNQGHACAVARGKEKTHKKHIFSYTKLNLNDIVQRLSKAYPRGRSK